VQREKEVKKKHQTSNIANAQNTTTQYISLTDYWGWRKDI